MCCHPARRESASTGERQLVGAVNTRVGYAGRARDERATLPDRPSDTITDFDTDDDTINLSAFGDDISFDDLTITADGDDAVIDLSSQGAGSVRLENVDVTDLDADDFVFAEATTRPTLYSATARRDSVGSGELPPPRPVGA